MESSNKIKPQPEALQGLITGILRPRGEKGGLGDWAVCSPLV